MVGVERVLEYRRLEQERSLVTSEEVRRKLPPSWPRSGAIRFEHVNFSYVDNETVLRDVTFDVKSGEKVKTKFKLTKKSIKKYFTILTMKRLASLDEPEQESRHSFKRSCSLVTMTAK